MKPWYTERMSKMIKPPHLAAALRHFAGLMCSSPDLYSQNDGKMMDRALRTCPGITDIDVVWVRWSYVAETRGWLTSDELVFNGRSGRYSYPAWIK